LFLRTQTTAGRTYLLLVENERVDGRIKQRVLHRLGRLDQLQSSGQLDSLLASLGRFSDKLAVLGAHDRGESVATRTRSIGAAMIFERLWHECGIGAVLGEQLSERRFEFPLERAVFMTVLHRLCVSGSDRAAERWMRSQAIAGTEELSLHHLYRAMGFLGEPLAPPSQAKVPTKATTKTSAKPKVSDDARHELRTRKDVIEEMLFARRRDLFTDVELVFFDTTSIYFEGEGGHSLGQRGHSKDHRPDLEQMVVGMVLDNAGHPLCSTMWPGNTTDVTSLAPVVKRLQTHFGIQRVCIVADRGMISDTTIADIESRGWLYILGVRMRRTKEARDEVLARAGRFQTVHAKSDDAKAPSPLQVKEVWVEQRRYVVCRNEDQAIKDAHDRLAIVAALVQALERGDKSLIGNNGFRRFVTGTGTRWRVDEAKVAEEARFDGKWVLRTNTDLSAREVALKYKQLWTVEAIFRTMKSQLDTRPIFHKTDDTIRGHVFCSFLALVLRKALQDRLEAKGHGELEWAHVLDDLSALREIELTVQGKRYRLRTETKGTLSAVFGACGVALPPALQPM
jgi:Transposase DDE domain